MPLLKEINAIGTVSYTNESKSKIDEARTAYDALTNDQKALITAKQLKVLTDAEAEYAALKAASEEKTPTLKISTDEEVETATEEVIEEKASDDKPEADTVVEIINENDTVEYTEECEDPIDEAPISPDVPQAEDPSHVALLATLLAVSVCGLLGLAIVIIRRTRN